MILIKRMASNNPQIEINEGNTINQFNNNETSRPAVKNFCDNNNQIQFDVNRETNVEAQAMPIQMPPMIPIQNDNYQAQEQNFMYPKPPPQENYGNFGISQPQMNLDQNDQFQYNQNFNQQGQLNLQQSQVQIYQAPQAFSQL
eukprot:TRINITY_DN6928_c0_g1_i1.p2 TRINITY_DN6928_c0_g1~~TRINITY_DN6928_c0_g1_i1.p2  ORF type:complete len:143 (-),score=14.50 TRINITY_DN6928_c0_g1_i1:20-448(-)